MLHFSMLKHNPILELNKTDLKSNEKNRNTSKDSSPWYFNKTVQGQCATTCTTLTHSAINVMLVIIFLPSQPSYSV